MANIHRQHIDHPSAWTNGSIGGKQGLVYELSPKHLRAFEAVLAQTAGLKPQEVTRAQFEHPHLNPMMAEVLDILRDGRGAVIVSGITRERFSEDDFERLYWGFGLHWGHAAIQSYKGDRIGRVTQTPVGPENPTDRGYKSSRELMLHTDNNVEVVGLMSVQKAAEGGYSILASSTAIHNELVAHHPQTLHALYEGYYMSSAEASLSKNPVTEAPIPVYCHVGGRLSCLYNRDFYDRAHKIRGDMPADFDEATKIFTAIADRPDIHVRFILEPGEIMFINNYTTLHARTPFEDSAERKRSMLRLWLTLPEPRPVAAAYRLRDSGYQPGTEISSATAEAAGKLYTCSLGTNRNIQAGI